VKTLKDLTTHISPVRHKTGLLNASLGKGVDESDMTVLETLNQIKTDMSVFDNLLCHVKAKVLAQERFGFFPP
jgi:hypothetical protein